MCVGGAAVVFVSGFQQLLSNLRAGFAGRRGGARSVRASFGFADHCVKTWGRNR